MKADFRALIKGRIAFKSKRTLIDRRIKSMDLIHYPENSPSNFCNLSAALELVNETSFDTVHIRRIVGPQNDIVTQRRTTHLFSFDWHCNYDDGEAQPRRPRFFINQQSKSPAPAARGATLIR